MIPFEQRHIGPDAGETEQMLRLLGLASLDELADRVVPETIADRIDLALPPAVSESDLLAELRAIADRNVAAVSMIGMGYHGTVTPPVIRRNLLENPAWYTAYTPYQPEISQGRLEALLNFQTLVADLTGLPTANASLLDEATAAAEAMALALRAHPGSGRRFLIADDLHPQTRTVLKTRAEAVGIELVEVDPTQPGELPWEEVFGLLVQTPGTRGRLVDVAPLAEAAHAAGALLIVAADPLSLLLLHAPGARGADVVVGSMQRFGVPMGCGGPHAAYLSVRAGLERQIPGRLVGVSVDSAGRPAYRLALQAREQHIRRDRATSNICTAQVLLAIVAAMYASYHGPAGLRSIAEHAHRAAVAAATGLRAGGLPVGPEAFFDTVTVSVPGRADQVMAAAAAAGVDLRRIDADTVGLSTDETTTDEHLRIVWAAFGVPAGPTIAETGPEIPPGLGRTDVPLQHPVFHQYRSETAMMRYLRRLSDRDLALDRGMIPLGSCTMKLNAAAEMEPITWPRFADVHPFAPADRFAGTAALVADLERMLAEVTGYAAVSVQPNAGSQGEFAGLLAIRAYHRSRGENGRDICLIPASAHGTNAASAVMSGMQVVVIACDDRGDVDLADLRAKLAEHGPAVAALMITYPSTHGVFEEQVAEICAAVHEVGGQVYVDGANLNAMVGLARPGRFGADVSHLNLHKTFCIPHGGGGPGVGPVAVAAHLARFLPGHPLDEEAPVGAVSAAPFGSALVLPISWAYLRLMGPDGLRRATATAILSANYVAARLQEHYPVLYSGATGLVAHECILDLRPLTKTTGVTVEDVAKRLMDYGFHAPTMAFPVAGTLMVEPTESEDLAEVERFCRAMIAIREEIDRVAAGEWPLETSPLRLAPHTAAVLAGEWDRPYSRAVGGLPAGDVDKYWPPVGRIDQAYGDRNLMCSCVPVTDYA